MTLRVGICLVGLALCFACSKDNDIINRTPVPAFQSSDGVDRILLDGSSSSDPDGNLLTYSWSSAAGDVVFSDPGKSVTYFKLPAGQVESTRQITLKVSDGKTEISSTEQIAIPALTPVRAFGLGKDLSEQVNNTVAYDWYLDQGNTGTYALVNCGPTSVTMAIKWFQEDFSGTPLDARLAYHSTGGWWYTADILGYLNTHQVTNMTIEISNIKDLETELDEGNIIILCLDMYYVSNGTDAEYRKDKFYRADDRGWGHFIVIKGYKKVDNKIFFEAYDPYSFGLHYQDLGIKGKDRYYTAADLDIATNNWWDYAIVISRNSPTGRRHAVDPGTIPNMPGR